MSELAQIEQRLAIVEADLAQLRSRLSSRSNDSNWVEQVSGSLADFSEEDYQEFLECCRKVREEAEGGEVGQS